MEKKSAGFTLVELLVAIALLGVVMGAIYSIFNSQRKSYLAQEQITEMQQNLRVAMYMMTREIRMAGHDPSRGAGAAIITAAANQIRFTMDITGGEADGVDNDGNGAIDEVGEGDGDVTDLNEDIAYLLADADGDGDTDLVRNDQSIGNNRLVAANIEALDFVYLAADRTTLATPVATPAAIRSIQVSVVARADRGDPGYTNSNTYQNQQGDDIFTAAGDSFRRKLLTIELKCRNIGL
jgi:type IV pilus assembly protein PilW